RVVVGGRVLGDGDLDWWRDRVGWASQHPALVPGTVGDNVAPRRARAGPAGRAVAASRAGPGSGGGQRGPRAARRRTGGDPGGGPAGRRRRVRPAAPRRARGGGA